MVICLAVTCCICISCCCYRCRKLPNLQGYFNDIDIAYTKMGLVKGCFKQLIWIMFRFLFLLFRTIIWLLLLRYCKIWSNRRKSSYKNTVHVQKILARHKIDQMFQPASDSNFLTMHHSFQDPEYIFSKNVTLYCINKKDAVFVECDPNINVFNSNVSAFLRIAQFQNARNLIFVPIHIFIELGEKVGKFNGKIVFLSNTGRCGSTLLSQVFEETEECVSLSEPDATNRLTNIRDKIPTEEFNDLARATINLLCKNPSPKTKCFVIKLLQPNLPLIPDLARLYPDARYIFMYRDGIHVAKSVAKIIQRTPMTSFLILLAKNCVCMRLGRILSRAAGLPIDDYDQFETIHDPLQYGTVMWAASLRRYLDFYDSGIDIAAVRYEDMVADTDFAMQQIFNFCQLTYAKEAVERAFSRDSQRGSPISQDKFGQFDHKEITDKVRQLTDYCCQVFEVPSIFENYIAKNTISHRSILDDTTSQSSNVTLSSQGSRSDIASQTSESGKNIPTSITCDTIVFHNECEGHETHASGDDEDDEASDNVRTGLLQDCNTAREQVGNDANVIETISHQTTGQSHQVNIIQESTYSLTANGTDANV